MATLAVTNSFSAGTTIVAADMNENFDDVEAFVNSTPGVIQNDIVDVKGDIIAATAADAVSRLAVGTNTYVLTADSTEATGLIWAAPTTGDITGLTAGTNIDISSATGPVPTIDLAVDAALVTGVDGTGVDVTFHSATAGDNMLWDASEEKLVITGTNGQNSLEVADGNVSITDDLTVSGNCTIQTLDMDTIVEGDIIYGSGADTLARLAKGSNDEVLTLASGVPSWAATGGLAWSGSTANGIGTYGSSSSIVAESTATYDGTTLALTTAGGGLKLDDLDSSDANTLDFYEEGLWTATLVPSDTGSITVSTSFDSMAYIRIGRMVFIQGTIELASVSSPVGTLRLGGIPFAQAGDLTDAADRGGGPSIAVAELSSAVEGIFMWGTVGGTTIDVLAGNGQTGYTQIANLVDASTKFVVSGSYYAAA